MAIVVKKLFESEMPKAGGGVTSDRITYHVSGGTSLECLTAPGIPNIGDAHPSIALVYADAKGIVQKYKDDSFVVEVLYSNDGRFRGTPTRDETNTNLRFTGIDAVRTELVIPVLMATPILTRVAITSTPSVETGYEYQRYDRKQPYYREEVTREVVVDSFSLSNLETIENNTYKVHVFPNDREYMMLPPTMYQQSNGQWKITYRWYWEPEVPVPTLPDEPTGIPGPLVGRYFVGPTEVRPAFHVYQVVPGSSGVSLPSGVTIYIPEVVVIDSAADQRGSPSGYLSLPGNPLAGM